MFIDGTWLFYSLVVGRTERSCPVKRIFGHKWKKYYNVDWIKLPIILEKNLNEQLKKRSLQPRQVEIVRTSVFTSLREDTAHGIRRSMIDDFYKVHFDTHMYVMDCSILTISVLAYRLFPLDL